MKLSHLPVALNTRAVSYAEGLRAGIAVAATVLAGQFFGLPHFGLAALGALLTCLADPGGPLARRAPAVLAFALLGALTYGGFGLVRAAGIGAAAPVAGLFIFAASFARIYGQGGLQVGNLLSVVTVLALDAPATPLQAAAQGLNFFAGAFWAACLTLVIWQVHPYAPGRQAVADVCFKLSRLARDLARLANADESLAAFGAHATLHRRGVRDAIETARGVAVATFRRRGLVSRRAAQLSVRLQTLEQLFAALIALSEILEISPPDRIRAATSIRLIAGWLAALAPDIVADRDLDSPKKRASMARLKSEAARLPATAPLRHVLDAISERLAVLVTASAPPGEAASDAQAALPQRLRIFGPIQANLSSGSIPMRHALRAAFVATPVLAWTMTADQRFSHWMVITMVLCLQPYFSATWVRSAERIAGTVLGGLLAAAIGLAAQTPAALAIIMLPLTMLAFSIRGVSFTAYIAVLTPMLVLLVEQIAPGADEMTVAFSRVIYTLAGGLLAIGANYLLWPGFEGGRLDTGMRNAVAAHAAYARAVFACLLEGAPPPDAARRAAGLASNNFEASLARALAEPHRGHDAEIERGAVVDAALRRMAGRLSLLLLDRPAIGGEAVFLWLDWARWLPAYLAGDPAPRPGLPDGPGADALTRLARQAELITG